MIQRGVWFKSSYSPEKSDCVEVMFVDVGAAGETEVAVRDSKAPEAGSFRLPSSGWLGLLASVRER